MAESELVNIDDKLVETAYTKITDTFTQYYHEAITSLLIKTEQDSSN